MARATSADARNSEGAEELLETLRGVESAALEAALRASLATNDALAENRDSHIEAFQAALGRVADAHAALQLGGAGKGAHGEIERVVGRLADRLSATAEAINASSFSAADAQSLLDFLTVDVRRGLGDKLDAIAATASKQQADSANSSKEARAVIDSAVDEIDQISLNVRLISLNASVEAARAGEAGRGFGVIASEIQNLATRSQVAVESVRRQLASIG